jgi:hypothetical protein
MIVSATLGVKTGDWVEYEGITTFEDQTTYSDLKAEILDVKDENVTLSLTFFENGEVFDVGIHSGKFGEADLQGLIIPIGLNLGDTFNEGQYSVTITGYEERNIGVEVRKIISGNPSQMSHLTVFWDVDTGFMVESLSQTEFSTVNVKIVDTNLWQMVESSPSPSSDPIPFGFSNPTTIILGTIIILVIVGILAYFKKYRK